MLENVPTNNANERKNLLELLLALAATSESHKKAIDRLVENQEAQQRTVVEQAEMINAHSEVLEGMQAAWTKNFADLGALVNQQTKVLELVRSMVLPDDEPVN